MSTDPLAVPRLKWRRVNDDQFVTENAADVGWSLDRYPTAWSRRGKNADWSRKWWLHTAGDELDPEVHETCPIVTSRQVTALNRHPDILRYADVLAAGWHNMCRRIQNGQPHAEQVIRRGHQYARCPSCSASPSWSTRSRSSTKRAAWGSSSAARTRPNRPIGTLACRSPTSRGREP
ncbi:MULTISPECIES: hypothetical protein [Streptomyces]|uniref:Uncharacterized protein n=2 Tax=Streptomyces TaxID=1883 RepID=A0ABV9J6B4_9ACTN